MGWAAGCCATANGIAGEIQKTGLQPRKLKRSDVNFQLMSKSRPLFLCYETNKQENKKAKGKGRKYKAVCLEEDTL